MGRRNKESAAQRTRQANRDHKRSQQSKPHGRAPLRRSLEDHQGDPHQSDFTPRLIVRSGHVRPLWAGHPWLFPQAVEVIEGDPKDGDEVIVIDAEGEALGRALFSEDSALIARIFTTDPACRFDREWLRGRITAAIALRQTLGLPSAETESYRLIHSEGDGIPGLIVDRFGQVLSAQWLTEGIRRRQALITEVLLELTKADRVIERGQREEASLLFLERGFRYNLPPEITQ